MPIEFSVQGRSWVAEGHRGRLLQSSRLIRQAKDATVLSGPSARVPEVKPPSLLPRITVSRPTIETLFSSPARIRQAVDRIPAWTDEGEGVAEVSDYLTKGLEEALKDRDPKPIVVLIGESHISNASVIAQLAAMKTLRSHSPTNGRPRLLLIEQPTDSARNLRSQVAKLNRGEVSTPRGMGPEWAEGAPLSMEMLLNESMGRREGQKFFHDRMLGKVCLAEQAGFQPLGFDTLSVEAQSLDTREAAMVQGAKSALDRSDEPALALLVVGASHMKALVEGLKGHSHVIALSEVNPQVQTPWARRAMSFTLGSESIRKIRCSEALESSRLDFNPLVRKLGLVYWPTQS